MFQSELTDADLEEELGPPGRDIRFVQTLTEINFF